MRIGVIAAYREEDWDAERIISAARRRFDVDVLEPTDFAAEIDGARSRVTVRGRDAAEWDLFLTPRALGDEGDPDVQLELYRMLAGAGVRMCNEVDALLVAIDKLRTSWELARAGLPTPPVRVVQTDAELDAALAALGDAVVKPMWGSLGEGIARVGGGDAADLRARLSRRGALYLQRFVGGARLDVRAFVVGGRVAAAIARTPAEGEFRANLELGARAEEIALDERTAALAVRAARVIGLDYAGVDLIVGDDTVSILEVNGTPSFRGIFAATGRDMAPAIVDEATRKQRLTMMQVQGGG